MGAGDGGGVGEVLMVFVSPIHEGWVCQTAQTLLCSGVGSRRRDTLGGCGSARPHGMSQGTCS